MRWAILTTDIAFVTDRIDLGEDPAIIEFAGQGLVSVRYRSDLDVADQGGCGSQPP